MTPTAWKMYKFSLLYLALLFVAMGVDRAVPFGQPDRPGVRVILDQPSAPVADRAARAIARTDRSAGSARRLPGRCLRLWPRVRPYRGGLSRRRPLVASSTLALAFPLVVQPCSTPPSWTATPPCSTGSPSACWCSSPIQAVLNYAQTYLSERHRRAGGGGAPPGALRQAAGHAAGVLRRPAHRRAHQPASPSTSGCCREC